jgi:hypothetical protein
LEIVHAFEESLMKSIKSILLFTLLALGFAAHVEAAVLYASTAAGAAGELYIINPLTGAVVQDIGPLNDGAGQNYGITGLAFHPTTGALYGSVANNVAATQAKLVSINPATAAVTVIGAFNVGNAGANPATMADIAFDAAGKLYGVGSVGGPQLYSINIATAQATIVGAGTGLTSTSGGGLSINPAGAFYGTPTSTRFGTYNSGTGAFTNITNPTKPVGGAYAALAFDGGVLYGLNLGPDTTGKPTQFVTFDLATGAVTNLGTSIAQLDAMAFRPVPEPTGLALLASAAGHGLLGRRRK